MKIFGFLLVGLINLLLRTDEASWEHRIEPSVVSVSSDYGIHALNRSSFPAGFLFGASSSAYQVEGAWNVDGKGESNWDKFTHKYPDRIKGRGNGDIACDSYHRYKEDVQLLKNMNADAYRFSISWARVLPRGNINQINEKGIQYYNDLINELIANGVQPVVTLLHYDIPQALEDEYGGFLSEKAVKDFHDYADLCFDRFGDRVKYWITINEGVGYAASGYGSGAFPPGRCSSWLNSNCTGGDSGTEPYIVAHNLLLAHADAVHSYRTKYQKLQKGIIGMSIPGTLSEPRSNSTIDRLAAKRYRDFTFGWFAHPIVYGDYPPIMRKVVGNRLPRFTRTQSKLLKGSFDFFGFNYYAAQYVFNFEIPSNIKIPPSYGTDVQAQNSYQDLLGNPIGEKLPLDWFYSYPIGIWKYLHYIKRAYKNPIIYITENGATDDNDPNLSLDEALKDERRIKYHFNHLTFIKKAIDDGVRVKAYFGWSVLDNFEWLDGYSVRFGLNFVDFKTFNRYPKLSAEWFKRFLQKQDLN